MTGIRKGGAYRSLEALVRPTLTIMAARSWSGMENIPPEGGVLLVANHVSYMDPLMLAHFVNNAGRPARFLAKASLFEVAVLGRMLRSAGQIPVYRQRRDVAASLDAACEAVERGECVVVMPEGTITRDPRLWPMVGKPGAARIALRTGCPVIPVGQRGPEMLLPPYRKLPRVLPRKRMRVTAGPPVDLGRWRNVPLTSTVTREATAEIMRRITGLVAELRGEQAPEKLFDPAAAGMPETGNPYRRKA